MHLHALTVSAQRSTQKVDANECHPYQYPREGLPQVCQLDAWEEPASEWTVPTTNHDGPPCTFCPLGSRERSRSMHDCLAVGSRTWPCRLKRNPQMLAFQDIILAFLKPRTLDLKVPPDPTCCQLASAWGRRSQTWAIRLLATP